MKKYIVLCASALALVACTNGRVPCSVHEQNAKTPIYFEYDSDKMTPESQAALEDGLIYLTGHRFKKIELEGWSDEQGGETDYNMELSKRRAETVRAYMISNGVRKDRISVKWHGVDQGNPYEQRRRVDVKIK